MGRLAPALAAVAALGLATIVITSPEAAEHGGGGDHDHDEGGQEAVMDQIDAERCDTGFNPTAYWEETEYLDVDVYEGGAMSATEHAPGHDDADAGYTNGDEGADTATTTSEPDPTGGRGSAALDELVSRTSLAGGGEIAASQLVTALADADDEVYDDWLWWLRESGTLAHDDHDSAATGDAGGHGGHVGPQPWVAMTDPAECDLLAEELALARETALSYPTAADATEAGWTRVAPYVPGIAAHYMNFSLVDGEFAVDEPEMILYDGNGPEARVVGLSYYITLDGETAPTQGFTGANDHSHRHVGLCTGPGGVIGDSTTTAEECEARGGTKADGSNGWMSHAWVVPGCESPWGVFSAASPVLDGDLSATSGENDGGCSASGVRDRYDMGEPTELQPVRASTPAADE
ncbi:hypothetical protein BH23ACT2_BH23ACT2_01380 [soil metagenome]